MKNKMAKCVGCKKNRNDKEVKKDGTYNPITDEYICDICYIKLIPFGLDIGTPQELAGNLRKVLEKEVIQ